jgi:hypothetical protein
MSLGHRHRRKHATMEGGGEAMVRWEEAVATADEKMGEVEGGRGRRRARQRSASGGRGRPRTTALTTPSRGGTSPLTRRTLSTRMTTGLALSSPTQCALVVISLVMNTFFSCFNEVDLPHSMLVDCCMICCRECGLIATV